MSLQISKGKLFAKSMKDRHEQTVLQNLKKFLEFKVDNPIARFGGSDYAFSGGGNLSGYSHVHLNRDKSLVYRIAKNVIYLYGIFTHGELGTGTPSNNNKQKSMKDKFDNQDFTV